MTRFIFTSVLVPVLFLLPLGTAQPAFADEINFVEETDATDFGVPISIEAAEAAAIEAVELPLSQTVVETHRVSSAAAGYRFVSVDGYGGRAAEYEDLRSGPEVSFAKGIFGRDHKFSLEGAFVTDNDYLADLSYDYMGAYRVKLRRESFYHNLDLLPSSIPAPFTAPPGISTYAGDSSRDASYYGIRVEQDQASLRARMGTYPIHLNLDYWRLNKEGNIQQRYADHAFFPQNTTNTVYAANRPIDRETQEGSIGFDAHLGVLDLIYGFTARQSKDYSGTPVDAFIDRQTAGFYQRTPGGLYEHNETPDSQYLAHNFKVHTEQTGGIVAAAAYTFAQRKNNSTLSQVSGVNGLTDTLQTAAGDFAYTPRKEFSLAVRFRHQEIDRDTAVVSANNFITPNPGNLILPNQGLDTTRDIISTMISYRPVNDFTVKGEYRAEFTSRNNTDSWDPYAQLSGIAIPSDTERHKAIISVLSKPYKNLRLKARYSYTTVNNPEYGTSYDERHEGQLLAIYTVKNKYGVSANYLVSHEDNDESAIRRYDFTAPVNFDLVPVFREKKQVSATASLWGNLLDGRISLTGTAGLLRSNADHQTLFAATSPDYTATASNYTSQALLYGLSISFRPVEKISTSLVLQQIRSYAEFEPTSTAVVDTTGIEEISNAKTTENSLSFRADYQFHQNVSCGIDYRFRDYNDKEQSMFDGTVHTVTTSMTARW